MEWTWKYAAERNNAKQWPKACLQQAVAGVWKKRMLIYCKMKWRLLNKIELNYWKLLNLKTNLNLTLGSIRSFSDVTIALLHSTGWPLQKSEWGPSYYSYSNDHDKIIHWVTKMYWTGWESPLAQQICKQN